MPVSGMNMSEGPLNPTEAKTAGDLWIVVNVLDVVVVNKPVPQRPAKGSPDNRCEENADEADDYAVTVSAGGVRRSCAARRSFFPPLQVFGVQCRKALSRTMLVPFLVYVSIEAITALYTYLNRKTSLNIAMRDRAFRKLFPGTMRQEFRVVDTSPKI